MTDGFPFLPALAVGFAINLLDIGCTLLFAAKPWEAELRRQGLEPRKLTPPYYIITNFVGGLILTFVYLQFAKAQGTGIVTALISSLVIWFVSRIYGGGHVIMGQMPLRIFLVMSIGLGVWQRFVSEKDTSLKSFQCNHFRGQFFDFLHLA